MATSKVERIVFVSLVLDLFAFTIPLPLFPRIIEWYTTREITDSHGLLSRTLAFVSYLRGMFYNPAQQSRRWDIVLLGGLMGSVFSTLQYLVSPRIGALSDKYGRKRVLLVSMAGNILSAIIWMQSTSFSSYILSRVVGGLSEGNVQLAIAIISDVTTPTNRSKSLAFVGIAFAICFCVGPPIGAYFALQPVPSIVKACGMELNVYAVPAFITLVLLVVETGFLAIALPETRGTKPPAPLQISTKSNADAAAPQIARKSPEDRLKLLGSLRRFHLLFLMIFSGVEFTLTFLTFDLLDWNNTQNGKLLASIGVVSALLQGGYVRRSLAKTGEIVMSRRGLSSCALALVCLALLPHFVGFNDLVVHRLLQAAAVLLAFTSATVVNSLTACASLQCDEGFDQSTGKPHSEHPQLAKGWALGKFRSSGQLGRAMGPLIACALYWTFGPSTTYAVSAAAMFILSATMK
ncbi:MFS DHA1 sub-family [Pterulicium gracile]|uniref:MFS DHA1 sub-family n=1 Tax=Pterulicium gracile TaxID=1884261 RepID=A0A5C3R031_9AGAR|nr:MFS DHA1 sub-family [Pterula gracilis]